MRSHFGNHSQVRRFERDDDDSDEYIADDTTQVSKVNTKRPKTPQLFRGLSHWQTKELLQDIEANGGINQFKFRKLLGGHVRLVCLPQAFHPHSHYLQSLYDPLEFCPSNHSVEEW